MAHPIQLPVSLQIRSCRSDQSGPETMQPLHGANGASIECPHDRKADVPIAQVEGSGTPPSD